MLNTEYGAYCFKHNLTVQREFMLCNFSEIILTCSILMFFKGALRCVQQKLTQSKLPIIIHDD